MAKLPRAEWPSERSGPIRGPGPFCSILGIFVAALLACSEPARPPSVILISIDTLRADRLSLLGHERPTSPRLDAWAEHRAVVFTDAISQAPWTLPAHASMLSGLDPLSHGVNHSWSVAPATLETLAERFRDAGYRTAALTGGGWLDPRFGLDQGFNRVHHWPGPDAGSAAVEWETHVTEALAWLDELRHPFFLFLHTYDVHGYMTPILPPELPDNLDQDARRRLLYDRAVSHMDAQLGRFLERLEAPDLEGRVIVVVTSDHGEGLTRVEVVGHGSLYDHTLRVPLVIALPGGRAAGRRITAQVRSIDIVPTLLDLAGLGVPGMLDGRTLRPLIEDTTAASPSLALSYMSVGPDAGLALRYAGRLKYRYQNTAWSGIHADEALFHLGRDPAERSNLAPAHPQAERFRDLARRLLEERAPGLRMRLTNTQGESFSGHIEGALVGPYTVKAVTLPCPCVELLAEKTASFTVPPGEELTLVFERPVEPTFGLRAALGNVRADDRPRLEVDLETLESPAYFQLGPKGWRAGRVPSGEPAAGVELRFNDTEDPLAARPRESDADLRRQLEALGYGG